jgi:hypothetical protein
MAGIITYTLVIKLNPQLEKQDDKTIDVANAAQQTV